MASGDKPTKMNLATFKFQPPQEVEDRNAALAINELQTAVRELYESVTSQGEAVEDIQTNSLSDVLDAIEEDPEYSKDSMVVAKRNIRELQNQHGYQSTTVEYMRNWQGNHIVSARAFFTNNPYQLIEHKDNSTVTITKSYAYFPDGSVNEIPEKTFNLPATGDGPMYIYQDVTEFSYTYQSVEAGSLPPEGPRYRVIAKLVEDTPSPARDNTWILEQLATGDWYALQPHPFQVTLAANGTDIEIGAWRVTNKFEDRIFVMDPADDNWKAVVTVKGTPDTSLDETDTLTPSVGTEYVYYRVWQDDLANWKCEPFLGATPTTPQAQRYLYVRVAEVTKTAGGVISIGQELYSNPMLWPRPLLQHNGPYYIDDGVVATGEIVLPQRLLYTPWGQDQIASKQFDLGVDTKIWVEFYVDEDGTGFTSSGLYQNGVFVSADYYDKTGTTITIKVLVGEVSSGQYFAYIKDDICLGTNVTLDGYKVKASSTDTTPEYLYDIIQSGVAATNTPIKLTQNPAGAGNQKVEFDFDIDQLTAVATLSDTDLFVLSEGTAETSRKITKANLATELGGGVTSIVEGTYIDVSAATGDVTVSVDLTEVAGYNAGNEQVLCNDNGVIEFWNTIDLEDALALITGFGATKTFQTTAGSVIEWG